MATFQLLANNIIYDAIHFLEPVGSVSPKITAGDDTKRMKIGRNTSTALLCQCQAFPVAIFRCLFAKIALNFSRTQWQFASLFEVETVEYIEKGIVQSNHVVVVAVIVDSLGRSTSGYLARIHRNVPTDVQSVCGTCVTLLVRV